MVPIRKLSWMALAAALALPSSASAQRAGQLTFYSEIAFRGQSYTVTGERENARVPFTVRSAQVAPGEAWEVCTQTRYRGTCNVVAETIGNVAWTVNSARPSRATTLPAPIPAPAPAPGNDQSLRGMTAEFFPQPSEGSGRVLSCARGSGSASCAAQSADRFCVSRGWTASSYERQETVAGRIYLADVLCTRTR
jgi:hypothetical protein